ncbi:hypothetical protein EDD11_000756 [Mortierella claussenii]|nr:hypothetical protein EDD11_000756 [Mortierella claussenii]
MGAETLPAQEELLYYQEKLLCCREKEIVKGTDQDLTTQAALVDHATVEVLERFAAEPYTQQPLLEIQQLAKTIARMCITWSEPRANVAHPTPVVLSQECRQMPAEIWAMVFRYVEFPSQLCAISRVCSMFYNTVADMPIWTRWFLQSHSESVYRAPTAGLSTNKCRMLHLCAESLLICEGCLLVRRGYYQNGRGYSLAGLPLPVAVAWIRQAKGEESKSDDAFGGWSVRLCLKCRKNVFAVIHEPIPADVANSFNSKINTMKIYRLGQKSVKSISDRRYERTPVEYSEEAALKLARVMYGGDVGIQASWKTPDDFILTTDSRLAYLRRKITALATVQSTE